jgi:hypothetical protein
MQIREISLKELYKAYELVKKIRDISYEEFEDLVYEMKENYIMIGVFDKEKLLSYAGLSIVTTLKDKRHIRVYDLAFLDEKSLKELKDYLEDYAKISMAKKVIYE